MYILKLKVLVLNLEFLGRKKNLLEGGMGHNLLKKSMPPAKNIALHSILSHIYHSNALDFETRRLTG